MNDQIPLSKRYEKAREIGAWETMGGAALALLGLLLLPIGTIAGSGSSVDQNIVAIGLIMVPLGLGILAVGTMRRREELRRVIFVEAPASNLRSETVSYIQANSHLGLNDMVRPEPAALTQKDTSGITAKMQILKSLLEKGLISEEEYQEKKKEILSRL